MTHYFILGPSGVGKSATAGWLSQNDGLRWLEIDRFPDGDGIDLENIRSEWDEFLIGARPSRLAGTLNSRAEENGHQGCVLSFPSGFLMAPTHVEVARTVGISVAILYGPAPECIQAFLERERQTGRNLSADHWILNNQRTYLGFSHPGFGELRVNAFTGDGSRRTVESIAADILGA